MINIVLGADSMHPIYKVNRPMYRIFGYISGV